MAKKELALTSGFTEEQIQTIKDTVAKDATTPELQMFIALANKYQLDPFAKELWFIKVSGRPVIMTSRDGYLTVAQRQPTYKGMMSFPVHENDDFSIDANKFSVQHKMNIKNPGKIIGAWAKVEDETKMPVVCFVKMKEYEGNSPVWRQYPSAMIQKVAEAFALKRMYSINGLVTKEEMDAQTDPMPAPKEPLVQRTEDGKFIAPALEVKTPHVFKHVTELQDAIPGAIVVTVGDHPITMAHVDQIQAMWEKIVELDPKLSDENKDEVFIQMLAKQTGKNDISKLLGSEAEGVITKMAQYTARLLNPTPTND